MLLTETDEIIIIKIIWFIMQTSFKRFDINIEI